MRLRPWMVRTVSLLGLAVLGGGVAVLLVARGRRTGAWAAWEQARDVFPSIDTYAVERAYRIWLTIEAAGVVTVAAGAYLLLVGAVLGVRLRVDRRSDREGGAIPSATRSIPTK